MPDHVWMCLNMPKYVTIRLNSLKSDRMVFVLHFPINHFSTWMHGYLFQRLHKTRISIKVHVAFFFKKNFFFSALVKSIWFAFCLRLNGFTSNTTNLMLLLGAEGAGANKFEFKSKIANKQHSVCNCTEINGEKLYWHAFLKSYTKMMLEMTRINGYMRCFWVW